MPAKIMQPKRCHQKNALIIVIKNARMMMYFNNAKKAHQKDAMKTRFRYTVENIPMCKDVHLYMANASSVIKR